MLYEPDESVTVIFAFGRSRITVSFWPEVTPLPAAPGKRAVGKVCVPTAVNWPELTMGTIGGCPLFQLVKVPQSPLLSFIQTAGTKESFKYSISPWATSTSRLAVVL